MLSYNISDGQSFSLYLKISSDEGLNVSPGWGATRSWCPSLSYFLPRWYWNLSLPSAWAFPGCVKDKHDSFIFSSFQRHPAHGAQSSRGSSQVAKTITHAVHGEPKTSTKIKLNGGKKFSLNVWCFYHSFHYHPVKLSLQLKRGR